MTKSKKGAPTLKELQAENKRLQAENDRLKKGGENQEKINQGKVLTIVEEDEEGNPLFEVDYQFARPNFVWPKFGKVSASQVIANPEKYATYIQKMIERKSELITEVARRAVEQGESNDVDYSIYEGVTIKDMKEALDAAGVKYDGSLRNRIDYLPLYHELDDKFKAGGE
ncbi:hypothetical protein GBO34_00755 [Roseivirga pacifica]|uniref:hypothetical protein n=1 Tax=Roseivirga pacifica TaxID=1267423 RepID=UPI0020955DFB|nr:hypothetical protein [Roseivirga pacifica]MCO6367842.1 hypothetical protein [Roseivirga pacifica]MCO6377214.1 hypothetical protein [Roseivirga pacifica]